MKTNTCLPDDLNFNRTTTRRSCMQNDAYQTLDTDWNVNHDLYKLKTANLGKGQMCLRKF